MDKQKPILIGWLRLAAFAAALLASPSAFAACASPAGNAGDVIYSSTSNVMAYCNGTTWVAMGNDSTTTFGTLTTGDICTATSGTQISCTTSGINLASQVTGILPGANGGTGVANTGETITLGGNLTTSGAYALTLTLTGATNVTLPTTGTLVNTAVTTLSSLGSVGTITSGTWNGTTITVPHGGTGATTLTQYGVLLGNGAGTVGATTAGATGTVLAGQGTANPIFTASPSLTNLTLSGDEILSFGTDYSTTGSHSDVALNTSSAFRYTGAAAATFYGIAAGTSGQILDLHNASAYTLTLSNQSTSDSTLANRIITGTGSDLAMAANSSVTMQYDGTTGRWRVIGGSGAAAGTATPAGTDTQIQYNDAGVMTGSAGLVYDYTNGRVGIGTPNPATQLHIYYTNIRADTPMITLGGFDEVMASDIISSIGYGYDPEIGSYDSLEFKNSEPSNVTGGYNFINADGSTVGVRINAEGDIGIGTTLPGSALTINGAETLLFGTDYSTTGSHSDVALNTASAFRYTGTAAATFYGIVAGRSGQILDLHNASAYTLTLSNQSTSDSTLANRIITGSGADLAMAANSSVTMQYDGTTARWRVIGGSGGGTPAGSNGQVQFNNAGAFGADSNMTWDNTNKMLAVGAGASIPVATTGTVAGVIVNVIPQAVSLPSGVSGAGVNTATTGDMAYYSGTGVLSGTGNVTVSGASTTVNGTLTLPGTASVPAAVLTNAAEPMTVSATAATGTINYYLASQSALYYTSNASANWTVNFAMSSGTTLNAALATGQTMTAAFLVTQGSTAYYNSAVEVDGTTSGVTTKWQGGAPTSGNASGVDVYQYTIVKTGSATYTVFALQVQYK